MRDVERLRSEVTASALESTIAFLGQIKEGRKAILLVSQTVGRVGTSINDTMQWLDGAVRLANANNTTIYTFDPRGLDMNERREPSVPPRIGFSIGVSPARRIAWRARSMISGRPSSTSRMGDFPGRGQRRPSDVAAVRISYAH